VAGDEDLAGRGKAHSRHVYWGTKLACLEMIKTGTTTFNDMYFHMDAAAKAVKEMGLRAFLAEGIVDLNDAERPRSSCGPRTR